LEVLYGQLALGGNEWLCHVLIPVIIVTFALQNQLLRGVTVGTIKR
jgi:hypothetical protein